MIRFLASFARSFTVASLLLPAAALADVIEVGPGTYRTISSDRHRSAVAAEAGGQAIAPALDEQSLSMTSPVHVPAQWAGKIAELSRRFDLSPALIAALVWQESRWKPTAISPVGARGLAQLMPGTARELGVNPDNPESNLEGGARYLRQQLDAFDGDIERALAAYNAGPGRVRRARGVPRIKETQLYVAAIVNRLADSSGR